MKSLCLVSGLLVLVGVLFAAQAEEAVPQKIIDKAHTELIVLGTDPVIVAAVKAENAKSKTLDQIKAMDKEWRATPGLSSYMKSMLDSDCGKHLRNIQESAAYYAEIFVMDNQGANVAMTDKTSDYWQGDEAKFIESYKDGAGAVHIGKIKFDDSTQAYLVQVSIPVKEDDVVIGAITIGIDVDQVEERSAER